jgi:hypothetical protein
MRDLVTGLLQKTKDEAQTLHAARLSALESVFPKTLLPLVECVAAYVDGTAWRSEEFFIAVMDKHGPRVKRLAHA